MFVRKPTIPLRCNRVPWVKNGALAFIAGQIPCWDGKLQHSGQPEVKLMLRASRPRLCLSNMFWPSW
jgi:hypothetical protein